MDIITEILETDESAQKSIDDAQEEKKRILAEAEKKAEQIKSDGRSELEEYRKQRKAEYSKTAQEKINASAEVTEKKKKELDRQYEQNHKVWEDMIIKEIWAE